MEILKQIDFNLMICLIMIGFMQSLSVFWIAYPYIKVRKNKKILIGFYIILFAMHDTF